MELRAVLTGDIIDSSRLEEAKFQMVMEQLGNELARLKNAERIDFYEMYRGDAFQTYLKNPGEGLNILFKIRTLINSLKPETDKRGQQPAFNIRFGLGIGFLSGEPDNLQTKETPFVLSGQALDKISTEGSTIAIKTENEFINQELDTEFFLLEYILQKWTPVAAGILYNKLYGQTERQIAGELGISQSAVNQHSRQACWNGIQKLIERYQSIINRLKNQVND